MPGRSGDTAQVLILIGLILQIATVLILFGVAAFFSFVPIFGGIVLVAAILGLIFVILVYIFSYARARDGDYDGARTPTLVFGILSLISLGLISGILYIVAYAKLGDAADEDEQLNPTDWVTYGGVRQPATAPVYSYAQPPGTAYPPTFAPAAPPPTGSIRCPNCGQLSDAPARYCRYCGARLQ